MRKFGLPLGVSTNCASPLNPRLSRHLVPFYLVRPSNESLFQVCQGMFTRLLLQREGCHQSVEGVSRGIIKCSIALHAEVEIAFKKDAESYYQVFGLKKLTEFIKGLCAVPAAELDIERLTILWRCQSDKIYKDMLRD